MPKEEYNIIRGIEERNNQENENEIKQKRSQESNGNRRESTKKSYLYYQVSEEKPNDEPVLIFNTVI